MAPAIAEASFKRKRSPSDEGDSLVRKGKTLPVFDDFNEQDDHDQENFDDYADEPSKFGSQALPVADLPNDYSGVPTDGMSYLFIVRRDANVLPQITRAVNPYEMPEVTGSVEPSGMSPINLHIPTSPWRATFGGRFQYLRDALKSQRSKTKPEVQLPKPKDRDGWWKFINGNKRLSEILWTGRYSALPGRAPSVPPDTNPSHLATTEVDGPVARPQKALDEVPVDEGQSEDEDEEEDEVSALFAFIQKTSIINEEAPTLNAATRPLPPSVRASTSSGSTLPPAPSPARSPVTTILPTASPSRSPTTSLILSLDHKTTYHLLMFYSYWIQKRLDEAIETPPQPILCLGDNDGKWILSLLAHLDSGLTGDEVSTLRKLARLCITILRGLLDAGENILQDGEACWMIISAVIVGWGQRDLWDDATNLLSSPR